MEKPINDNRARRVYVGNLSWQTRWQELKDHMRKAGNVVRANILEDQEGRSKGCAIVTYETPEEARNAIDTLTDTELMNRRIFVREDREDNTSVRTARAPPVGGGNVGGGSGGRGVGGGGFRGGYGGPPPGGYVNETRGYGPRADVPGSCGVFVQNLPWSVTWQDLKDKFQAAGEVVRADVLGRSRGQGIVIFRQTAAAKQAIEMFDEADWHGRQIRVKVDERRNSGGRPYENVVPHNQRVPQGAPAMRWT